MFEQMKGLSPKKKNEYYIQYYGAATAKDVAEGMRTCNQIINMNKVSIDD